MKLLEKRAEQVRDIKDKQVFENARNMLLDRKSHEAQNRIMQELAMRYRVAWNIPRGNGAAQPAPNNVPSSLLVRVRAEMARVIVGQEALIDRLLMALLCNNHVLIEGLPGLAKTLTVPTLARCLDATYHRIQFTPDLLPADVVGTMIYNPKTGDFSTKKGPIFANIILADEINRAISY